MIKPTILVTGATGKTGSAVASQLLEQGFPVRAAVRQIDPRSERLQQAGAEIVITDVFDPGRLLQAMKGVARAYYCPPFHPEMVQSATAFAAAAQEAKLESVVSLTQWLASSSHPSLSTRHHWLADENFSQMKDVAVTNVAPGFFASYPYMRLIDYAVHLGLFPLPVDGESKNAPPSDEDIARIAVAALIDPGKHAGRTYRPTGPHLISVLEMAEILSRVLKRKVRHVKVPMWIFLKAARLDGTSPFVLSNLPYYFQDQNAGAFAFGAPTGHVFEVTGRQPEAFEMIARRYAALPNAQRTVRNKLRTWANFMRVPFQPGVEPVKIQRAGDDHIPSSLRLAMDNPRWREERGLVAASAGSILNSQLEFL